jgi:exonuclease SbcC
MMKRFFVILISCLWLAVPLFAQSNKLIRELESKRGALQKQIAESESILKDTKKDVGSQLNSLAVLTGQIEERKRYIMAINNDVEAIQRELASLERQLHGLEKDLKDKKKKYEASIQYLYKNKSIEEKLMFIFSAKNLGQTYRRMRYVREYATYQRLQGEEILKKQEQIRKEEEAGAERGRTRVERIMGLETAIAAKREQIRTGHENVDRLEEQLAGVQRADEALQELEAGDTALEACLEKIAEMMSLFPDARQTDWDKVIAEKKGRLQTATERLKDCDAVLKQAEQELKNRTDGWEQFKKEYAAFCEAYRDQSDTTAERLREIDIRLRDLSGSIEELRHKRRIVSAGIDGLSNKLAGSITCPFCGYEFLVAEPQFDIKAGMKELKLRQRQLTEINGRIDEKQEETDAVELQQNRLNHERRILEGRRTGWEEQLAGHERAVRNATRHVEEVESGHKRIASEITALQSEIEGVRRKVFDEVFGFIDERNAALNRGIRVGKEDIQAAACAIDTLQATIRELDEAASPDLIQSLKDTLRETRGKSNEAAGRKTAVDTRVRALEIQRERFVQFKTYLANTKIEALSRITNEFLQDIGSDIRIRFDGYTVLKSGKVREKISISLLRDGMDCGSFGKFSAGEAARVNLATILAMQKLVNSNCDGDKGLDLLVLDEILEAVDEAGLASMFEALNSLGGTVLVVSHGNVAEGYPHKLVIVKENGESRLGE